MMMMIIIIIIIKTTRTATIAIIIKQWRIWKRVSSIRDSIDLQQFNAVLSLIRSATLVLLLND